MPPPETPAQDRAGAVRERRRRRSSAAAAAAAAGTRLLETARAAEAGAQRALLLLWDELPAWRRDNGFIQGGYRPTSHSFRGSLASLGYLHNESVNIWSHLAGAAVSACGAVYLYALVVPRYYSASVSGADVLVFSCFFAGAVACLAMSAVYHALCNHSAAVARWGNKLDYSGIVFLIVGSYVPSLYYGLFCRPALLALYLYLICLLGLACLVVSWFEHFRTPRWRPYRALMFVGLGLSSVVPVVHALRLYGFRHMDERMGLRWVFLQGALYIIGAFIYAVRWPERAFPGKFDIWGSSHQIFHFFVLLAAAAHMYGMAKAFDFHHTGMGARC